ncbi:MAG: hypothetical protein HYU36_17005 [Planctomycetes bacterium]|nr:hypothetical protein [Planctomycetota bacterium]
MKNKFRCDFCGIETDWVARVAIAPSYNRMYSEPKYACRACHEKKEHERETSIRKPPSPPPPQQA